MANNSWKPFPPDDPIFREGISRSHPLLERKKLLAMEKESPPLKKLALTAVDGTKTKEELMQILLHQLEKSGIPVKMRPKQRQKSNMPKEASKETKPLTEKRTKKKKT
jgi:methyltransferase-like protein